jgi:hypothetical protein
MTMRAIGLTLAASSRGRRADAIELRFAPRCVEVRHESAEIAVGNDPLTMPFRMAACGSAGRTKDGAAVRVPVYCRRPEEHMKQSAWLVGRLVCASALVALLAVAPGCGDDDDDGGDDDAPMADAGPNGNAPTCSDTFSACGGDLAGNWTIVDACGLSQPYDQCPAATIEADVTVTGTTSFEAGGTYSITSTTVGTASIELPASCLPPLVTSCDQIEALFEDGQCTGTPQTSCACTFTINQTETEPGAYTVSGTVVTLDPDGEGEDQGPRPTDYCVDGTYLTTRTQGGAPFFILKK